MLGTEATCMNTCILVAFGSNHEHCDIDKAPDPCLC